MLYRKSEFEGEAIIPCIIASIIAYTTRMALTGAERAIEIPEGIVGTLGFGGLTELPFYIALALVCVLFGWAYIAIFNAVHARFEARPSREPRAAVSTKAAAHVRLGPGADGLAHFVLGALARQYQQIQMSMLSRSFPRGLGR